MPYFTLSKAKRLCGLSCKELSDVQLQKKIVKLRDYDRYISDTTTHRKVLVEGGHFNILVDPSASGLVPKDPFLNQNLRVSLDEALKEKEKRSD